MEQFAILGLLQILMQQPPSTISMLYKVQQSTTAVRKTFGVVLESSTSTSSIKMLQPQVTEYYYKGWDARVFQHEYDHLDSIVYIDRLTPEDRELVQPRLNELIAEFGDGTGGIP